MGYRAVHEGHSGVLVLRGEAGIGKTVLLDYAVEAASGYRVARVTCVESEMELSFAGVHQLCAQMLHRLDHLPGPQRDALSSALGLTVGAAPDRLLVGPRPAPASAQAQARHLRRPRPAPGHRFPGRSPWPVRPLGKRSG